MPDRIQEIRARCEAATPGPWMPGYTAHGVYPAVFAHGVHEPIASRVRSMRSYNGGCDAEFIAAARDDIPWLLDQFTAARANSAILEHIIESGGNPLDKDKIVSLILENTDLKRQLTEAHADLARCTTGNGTYISLAAHNRLLLAEHAKHDETQRNLREKVCIVERQREQITELEGELTASQRGEQAALSDINLVNSCIVCKHGAAGGGRFLPHCDKFKATKTPHDCDNFEWRGLQEAGEEIR